MKIPKDLKREGKALWASITEHFEVEGVEHLLAEACRMQDRLADLRALMAAATAADLGRLVNGEAKVMASQARLWRLMGLDKVEPAKGGK